MYMADWPFDTDGKFSHDFNWGSVYPSTTCPSFGRVVYCLFCGHLPTIWQSSFCFLILSYPFPLCISLFSLFFCAEVLFLMVISQRLCFCSFTD